MSITVKNIDQYKLMDKLKKSHCPLCKEALDAIKSYEHLMDIDQQLMRKAIGRIRELSKKPEE